jgi:hypothetical protein
MQSHEKNFAFFPKRNKNPLKSFKQQKKELHPAGVQRMAEKQES